MATEGYTATVAKLNTIVIIVMQASNASEQESVTNEPRYCFA